MIPLTRRDRAALSLALHVLRRTPARSQRKGTPWWREQRVQVRGILLYGDDVSQMLSDAFTMATWPVYDSPPLWWELRPACRRLALCIRAVLRADAGDFGPKKISDEAIAYLRLDADGMQAHGGFRHRMGDTWSRRIRPLWELAPSSKEKP